MSILSATVHIKGTKTLAWHHFSHRALPLEPKEKRGVAGHDPEEWRDTVLMNSKRQLFLPPTYFFGCVKNGGKHVKKGRGSILNDIAATIQIEDTQIFLNREKSILTLPKKPEIIDAFSRTDDDLPSVYVERIGVRNPSTKARNIRYRVATKPGWHCTFTILWDGVIVARNHMESAIKNAGKLVGLADGRGSIGYGRFDVLDFAIAEE